MIVEFNNLLEFKLLSVIVGDFVFCGQTQDSVSCLSLLIIIISV